MVAQHAAHTFAGQQMVPVSKAVIHSLEVFQRELAERLRGLHAWSPPASGFCVHLLQLARLDSTWATPPAKWPQPSVNLDEAPGLATLGYYLSFHGGAVDPELMAAWREGFSRLKERDPLPRDRQTFLHRAVELLGIILGARIVQTDTAWIRDALIRKPRQASPEPYSEIVTAYAAHLVGAPGSVSFVGVANIPVEAHALLTVLLHERLVPTPAHLHPAGLAEMQELLLHRLLDADHPADEPRLTAVLAGLKLARRERLSAELQAVGEIDRSQHDVLLLLEQVARNFEAFARQINQRHSRRTGFEFKDEYDVQDAFHAILRLHFEDVRAEEYTPSVAGKHGRLDFLLPQFRVAVETKMTRKGLGRDELISELGEDTIRFKKHPELEHLFCFVYDPSKLCHNPAAVESDLSNSRNHPRIHVVVSSR